MDTASAPGAAFAVHDDALLDVLGPCPRLDLLIETDAYERPVYVAEEDALYFTTSPRPGAEDLHRRQRIKPDFDPTTVEARAAWDAAQGAVASA